MKEMICPRCQGGDKLRTEESMVAHIPCEVILEEDGPQYDPREEIIYTSTEITGVSCECGWTYSGPDWMRHLQ